MSCICRPERREAEAISEHAFSEYLMWNMMEYGDVCLLFSVSRTGRRRTASSHGMEQGCPPVTVLTRRCDAMGLLA